MADWKTQYETFMKSEFGKHVIETLEGMAEQSIREATKQPTADLAYGLIKEAGGVIKAVDHFKTGESF